MHEALSAHALQREVSVGGGASSDLEDADVVHALQVSASDAVQVVLHDKPRNKAGQMCALAVKPVPQPIPLTSSPPAHPLL